MNSGLFLALSHFEKYIAQHHPFKFETDADGFTLQAHYELGQEQAVPTVQNIKKLH